MTTSESTGYRYHVQSTASSTRGGFPYFAYHETVSGLWAEKWRRQCSMGVYPFGEGRLQDFEPIFEQLIRTSGDDPSILLRPDDYAEPFLSVGDRLAADAEKALEASDSEAAIELFLRAAAVYRIARLPVIRSARGEEAWAKGKAAYEKGGRLLDPSVVPVDIPFSCADMSAGDRDDPIPAYLRIPVGEPTADGWPVLLLLAGLDGYRTDLTSITQEHAERGLVTLTVEIPGTGDCPAAPNDPTSAERLMTSVLDWISANRSSHALDDSKIILRGVSTGGYHAARAAHTHADRLHAAVVHGGGCHHMFDADWVHAQDQMEFPFALAEALAWKFGYRDGDPAAAVSQYAADGGKFSLLEAGIIGTPACRMLVINGMEDSIFPIEDSIIIATDGVGKTLSIKGSGRHMGEPGAEEIVSDWIQDALSGKV